MQKVQTQHTVDEIFEVSDYKKRFEDALISVNVNLFTFELCELYELLHSSTLTALHAFNAEDPFKLQPVCVELFNVAAGNNAADVAVLFRTSFTLAQVAVVLVKGN